MTVLLEVPTQAQLDKLRKEYKILGILTPEESPEVTNSIATVDVSQLGGTLSKAATAQIQQEIAQMRDEWDRGF